METHLKSFGEYLLVNRLAEGGMGEIYRARKVTAGPSDPLWAVKIIRRPDGMDSDSALSTEEAIRMFRAEAEVLRRLRHPNIITLVDYGAVHGQAYIAMELLQGKNIREITHRAREAGERMPILVSSWLAYQIAQALDFAHRYRDEASGTPMRIIHRDVSPQNIVVTYDGSAKLLDFGIAKFVGRQDKTRTGILKGKPSYLAPEQVNGEQLDERCDVFNLGIVIWECLTGKKLFKGATPLEIIGAIANCDKTVVAPSTVNPTIPRELDAVVMKALAKNRNQRHFSAGALASELNAVCDRLWPGWKEIARRTTATYLRSRFEQEIRQEKEMTAELDEISKSVIYAAPSLQAPQLDDALDQGTGDAVLPVLPTRLPQLPKGAADSTADSSLAAIVQVRQHFAPAPKLPERRDEDHKTHIFRKPVPDFQVDASAESAVEIEMAPVLRKSDPSQMVRPRVLGALTRTETARSKSRSSKSSRSTSRRRKSSGVFGTLMANAPFLMVVAGVLYLGACLAESPDSILGNRLKSMLKAQSESFLQLSRSASN